MEDDGLLGLDEIPGTGNGYASPSADVETLKRKWDTRSEGFKQEGSGFRFGDAAAKTGALYSPAVTSCTADMLGISCSCKPETSATSYFQHIETPPSQIAGILCNHFIQCIVLFRSQKHC